MNTGRLGTSAWIPPGLLPSKDDKRAYEREYYRLRLIYDPYYRDYLRKASREKNKRRSRRMKEKALKAQA